MEEAQVVVAEPEEAVEIVTEALIAEPTVEEQIIQAAPIIEAPVEVPASIVEEAQVAVVEEAAPIEQLTIAVEETPALTVEAAPIIETPVEAPAETIIATEPIAEVAHEEQPVIEAPLQDFEVTEQAPIETTLEKVLEEPAIETISLVEGGTHSVPPFRSAPSGAFGTDNGSGQQRPNPPSRRKRRKHN